MGVSKTLGVYSNSYSALLSSLALDSGVLGYSIEQLRGASAAHCSLIDRAVTLTHRTNFREGAPLTHSARPCCPRFLQIFVHYSPTVFTGA
jgi:hypothetical protein